MENLKKSWKKSWNLKRSKGYKPCLGRITVPVFPLLCEDKALNELVASINKCGYFEQSQGDGEEEEEEEEEAAENENTEADQEGTGDNAQQTEVSTNQQ